MSTQETIKQIPISDIDFSKQKIIARFETEPPESEELQELVASVKLSGVIEPIILRPKGSRGYEVVAGNRRLRAAKIAKLGFVPSIVKDLDDIQARRLAFVENVIRKSLNAMQMAKGLAAMYKDVGIHEEIAIKKIHRIKNEETRGANKSANRALISKKPPDPKADPTKEFMAVYNSIPLGADRQYRLLELVTHLTEEIQDHVEEANLPHYKAELITHTKLRDHPKIQSHIIESIRNKNVSANKARQIANQTVRDIETGNIWEDEKTGGVGISSMRTEEEKIERDPEIDKTFDVKIPDFRRLILTTIGKLLSRPIARGELFYDAKVWRPKLEEFKKNLQSIKKRDRQWLAQDAVILGAICKAIVESAQ